MRYKTSFQAPRGLNLFAAGCLVVLGVAGCAEYDADEVPDLPVSSVRYWSMPAEGAKIPAPRSIHVASDQTIYVLDDAGRVGVCVRNNL